MWETQKSGHMNKKLQNLITLRKLQFQWGYLVLPLSSIK